MAPPALLASRETGSWHRSRQMVSPWLLPEGDHLAAGLFSHGCESSGNGGELGGGGSQIMLEWDSGEGGVHHPSQTLESSPREHGWTLPSLPS